MADKFGLKIRFARNFQGGGFTFPPKEGVMRMFSPEKSDGFSRV
jgi:hypothetical protein